MEERHRDDGFEATFVVGTPRAQAWKLLTEARPARDGLPAAGPGEWWVPGVEGAGEPLEVVPEVRLHVRKTTFPCAGTDIVVTMEDAETGTRITFAQFGFDHFEKARDALELGWWAIRADLFVFFEHGVSGGRHLRPWHGIGCGFTETPGGLVVTDVARGGCADVAGVQVGDLLLTVAGSPVLTRREMTALTRGPIAPGTTVALTYLRGSEIRRGRGTA